MSYFHRAWSTRVSISHLLFFFFFSVNCCYYIMGIQGWYDLSYFLSAVGLSLRFYNNIPFQSIILSYLRIKICFPGDLNLQYFQVISCTNIHSKRNITILVVVVLDSLRTRRHMQKFFRQGIKSHISTIIRLQN